MASERGPALLEDRPEMRPLRPGECLLQPSFRPRLQVAARGGTATRPFLTRLWSLETMQLGVWEAPYSL